MHGAVRGEEWMREEMWLRGHGLYDGSAREIQHSKDASQEQHIQALYLVCNATARKQLVN